MKIISAREASLITLDCGQAGNLGKSIEVKENISQSLEWVAAGACAVNSGVYVMNNKSTSLYCIGFACGSDEVYRPHAWVISDGSYLECSPQNGRLSKYILAKEISYEELIKIVQDSKINTSNGFIPPLMDSAGNLYTLTPDVNTSGKG